MKTLVFTIVTMATIGVACCHAQSDSLDITMANVLDKTIDRVCEGLGEFADQSGMAVETAWPYAVKYVLMKETIPAIICFVVILLPLIVFIWAFKNVRKHYDPKESLGYQSRTFDAWMPTIIVSGVVFVLMLIPVTINLYFALLAITFPEAVTVEYLIKLL